MAFSHSGVVGGTGPIQPRYQRNRQKLVSLGIIDNINENYYLSSHHIEFCRPIPTDHFNCTATSTGLITTVSSGTVNMSCSAGGKTSNLSVITVISPANITMQNITVGGIPCINGCVITCSASCPEIVDIVITWANSGDISGTFTPWVTIAGGTPITGMQITVLPGATGTTTFTGVSLPHGTPSVCANTGTVT